VRGNFGETDAWKRSTEGAPGHQQWKGENGRRLSEKKGKKVLKSGKGMITRRSKNRNGNKRGGGARIGEETHFSLKVYKLAVSEAKRETEMGATCQKKKKDGGVKGYPSRTRLLLKGGANADIRI